MDIVAVVGARARERRRHAEWVADSSELRLVTATDLRDGDPIGQVSDLLRWCSAAGMVVEFPTVIDVMDVIGSTAATSSGGRLAGIVCVVDAVHLLEDLDRDDYVATPPPASTEMTAAALLLARQIEYASAVALVNWESLSTASLSTLMALISYLGPRAQVRLHSDDVATLPAQAGYTTAQDRPGWVQLLNGDFDPRMSDARVSALRYEHLRPLHPGRAELLLDVIGSGRFGEVIRSVGFCRLASRPNVVAQWDHVGQMMSLTPLAVDGYGPADGELLSIGQELGFIGLDLDAEGLRAALDRAALTDTEFAAGPQTWVGFADRFPQWQIASGLTD